MAAAVFGQEALDQLRAVVRRVLGEHRNEMPQRARWTSPPADRRLVAIIGTLSAPSDSASDPTSVTAAILVMDSNRLLVDSGHRLTVYNHDESLEATDGTLARVEFICGVWSVYWLACAPSSSFQDLPEEPF